MGWTRKLWEERANSESSRLKVHPLKYKLGGKSSPELVARNQKTKKKIEAHSGSLFKDLEKRYGVVEIGMKVDDPRGGEMKGWDQN